MLAELSLAAFQLAKDFQDFAAQRHGHAELLPFVYDVRESGVDLSADFLLYVMERALTMLEFRALGECIDGVVF